MKRPVVIVLCLSLLACGPGGEHEGEVAQSLAMKVGALGVPCEGNANSFNSIDTIRVCGEARISGVEGGPSVERTLFDRVLPVSDTMTLGDIPVSDSYKLTVVGEFEGESTYLGLVEDVAVSVGSTADVGVEWLPYSGTSCVSVNAAGKPAHRAFAAGTILPDGSYFFGGGFSAFQATSDNGGTLKPGSTKTYLFDAATATLSSGPDLKYGRGGHTMVYVPQAQQVLVIGGLSEMSYSGENGVFPFTMDSVVAIPQVEVIDFSAELPVLVSQSSNDELKLNKQRVFPKALVTATGEVLVSGGYDWAKNPDDPNNTEAGGYKKIEVLVNVGDGAEASWQLDPSIALNDETARSGHSFDWIKNEQTSLGKTMEVLLLWGGSRGSSSAATIIRSISDGDKSRISPTLDDGGTGFIPSFFHSMTHLGDGRLLAIGGVSPGEDGKLSQLLDDQAYLIEYSNADGNNPTLTITKQPGLNPGRYFHTAQFHTGGTVSAFGGFIDLEGNATDEIVGYNQNGNNAINILKAVNDFPARAAHLSVPLQMGGTYLATGIGAMSDLGLEEAMLSQLMVSPAFDICVSPTPQPGEGVE